MQRDAPVKTVITVSILASIKNNPEMKKLLQDMRVLQINEDFIRSHLYNILSNITKTNILMNINDKSGKPKKKDQLNESLHSSVIRKHLHVSHEHKLTGTSVFENLVHNILKEYHGFKRVAPSSNPRWCIC